MQSVPLDQIGPEAAERRIERVYALPSPPGAVRQLLAIQRDSLQGNQLHNLFHTHPNLRRQVAACLQLLRTFADANEKDCDEACLVHRIALAISVARSFSYVCNGPLGAHAFWHHGLSNAVLCYRLAPRRLCKGTAFMAGLLHNIGFMVIAYLFPPEFKMLNRLFASHPEMSATVLERCALGLGEAQELLSMGHAHTGSWLLQQWGMPVEPSIVAREHHNAGYRGDAGDYCSLVIAANRLLATHAIGDTSADPLDGDQYPEHVAVDSSLTDMARDLASVPESMAIAVRQLIAGPNHQRA